MFNSLKHKLFGTYLAGLIGIIFIILFTFFQKYYSLQHYIDQKNNKIQTQVVSLRVSLAKSIQEWKNVLLRSYDEQLLERYWNQAKVSLEDVQRGIGALLSKQTELDNSTRLKLENFKESFERLNRSYLTQYDKLISSELSIRKIDKEIISIDRPVANLLDTLLVDLHQQVVLLTEKHQDESTSLLRQLLISLTLASILVSIIVYFQLNTRVLVPVEGLIQNVHQLALSNFHFDVSYKKSDEIGQLGRSVQQLKEKMTESVSLIGTVAFQVDNAFEQLSKLSVHISKGAAFQINAVESLNHTFDQQSELTNVLKESAEQSKDAVFQIETAVNQCLVDVNQNDTNVKALIVEISKASEQIHLLSNETEDIEKILSAINAVSEQTNLLALNAAIEAARAGDAGRGFAVVADEVRSLALKTQESTHLITQVLESLRNSSNKAVVSIKQGNDMAEKTGKQAIDLVERLAIVQVQLDKIQQEVDSLTSNSEEQQACINNLRSSVDTINATSKDYESIADDKTVSRAIGMASKELKKLSEGLSENTPEDSDELF